MWAVGHNVAVAEPWSLGDVLKFRRVVRHQMKDLKAKFEQVHHEVVFAGRFYQIEPEKNMVSKYHTILALTVGTKDREQASLWKVKLRPDEVQIQQGGIEEMQLDHVTSIGTYTNNLLAGGSDASSWFTLFTDLGPNNKQMHWAARTRQDYECFVWCLYQVCRKHSGGASGGGDFPRSTLDVTELDRNATRNHFKYLFDFGTDYEAVPLVGGQSAHDTKLYTVQEEKELEVLLQDFDVSTDNIHDFEQEQARSLGNEENLNIKRFLEAQQVSAATHQTLFRAHAHVMDIEGMMRKLEKEALKRPTQDLKDFRDDNELLKVESKNQALLLVEVKDLMRRLKVEEEEEELVKDPFDGKKPKNLKGLVDVVNKLIEGLKTDSVQKNMNIVREKMDEFGRLALKLNDKTEDFMAYQFEEVQEVALKAEYNPAADFSSFVKGQIVPYGVHEKLKPLTEFINRFCDLEETLNTALPKERLNYQLSDDYAKAFGKVYLTHFTKLVDEVMNRSNNSSRNACFMDFEREGEPGQKTAFIKADLYKEVDGVQENWTFADLREKSDGESPPDWVAIAALIELFLSKAYTESSFVDSFFSLAGDTDNDASDKANLMQMLYESLLDLFYDIIDTAHDRSELNTLVLSLLVAKVRGMCDMSDMMRYLQHFLTCLEMKLQSKLNEYTDEIVEDIMGENPSPSRCNILDSVKQLPKFVSHLVACSEMISAYPFPQIVHTAESEEVEENQLASGPSLLAGQTAVQKSWLAEAVLQHQRDAHEASKAVKSAGDGKAGAGAEDGEPEGDMVSQDASQDGNFNLYCVDSIVHKLVVAVFQNIERIATADVRYTSIVALQNHFHFSYLFSRPGPLGASLFAVNARSGSNGIQYIVEARRQYFMSMDEYVRWLVTSELREAMAYFDEVDALLKSQRQTPQEIDCCHPYKEFNDVVSACLSKEKIKKTWKCMLESVEDNFDDWMIRSAVITRLEEYYTQQYSKYLNLTMRVYPTYIKCFGDDEPDCSVESLMKRLVEKLIPKAVFKMFLVDGSDLEKQKEQWWLGFPDDPKYAGTADNPKTTPEEKFAAMEEAERDKWYSLFPMDMSKPFGPANQRPYKARCIKQVRKAIMLQGLEDFGDDELANTEVNELSNNGERESGSVTVEMSL